MKAPKWMKARLVTAAVVGALLGGGPAFAATLGVTSSKVAVFGYATSAVPTTAAISFPAASGIYNAAGFDAGCSTPGGDLCGTASAPDGLSKVEVSIRRSSDGFYWNGSSFASVGEQLFTASGTDNWSYPLASADLSTNGNYVVRAVATSTSAATGSSSVTFTIDNSLPSVAITFAAAGATYGGAGYDAGCATPTGDFCGTATDAGNNLTGVQVSVKRSSDGTYWNGTAFSGTSEQLLNASGTGSWNLVFPASNFPATGSYVVRAVATDTAGNTTSSSTTFTMDISAPTATNTFPVDGGFYNTAGFNAGCSTPGGDFCGTAADVGSSLQDVKVSIRRSSDSNYWNGSGFASALEVLFNATGTATWSYVFTGSSFPADGAYVLRAVPTDTAGNVGTAASSFTIDNTAPATTDVQTANVAAGTAGKAEAGDTITFTFSEPMGPASILAGWNGSSTTVVVGFTRGTGQSNDSFTINATNLGSVNLGSKEYVTSNITFDASSMVMTGSQLVVTLGTPSNPAKVATATTNVVMAWTPVTGPTDRAGNALPTTTRNESGTADKEF
jgi:hypothetical protein